MAAAASPTCGRVKSFKDPVHGYCDICHEVAGVVDAWYMQRLRWIHQTGFSHLVYHGMEHSRFNHSLGVAHLAREVLGYVLSNSRLYYPAASAGELTVLTTATPVFQLAALIHDLGHLPFSHSSEVGILDARKVFAVKEFEKLPDRHEEYTYSLIPLVAGDAEEYGVQPVFTSRLTDDLKLILQGPGAAGSQPLLPGGGHLASPWCATNILNRLLAGGLDVDRMDYLLRDSIYAGVRYGVFDVDRLARTLMAVPLLIGPDSRPAPEACSIAVLDKGVSIVETFLLARFYMFSEVYLHRVVEAYNSLYARLLALLARDNVVTILGGGGELEIPLASQVEKMEQDALKAWRRLDDVEMMSLIRRVAAGETRASIEARRIAEMIVERRHPKTQVFIEDEKLWGLYHYYLTGMQSIDPAVAEKFRELVELQNENPLIIVRPLRVDFVSLQNLNIYSRREAALITLEKARSETRSELARLRKLAELGLHRIAVFAPTREEAERAVNILREAASELQSGQETTANT